MYGTVMIAQLAPGATIDEYDVVSKDWLARRVDGFVDEQVLLGDDHRTVVAAVRFRDRAAYDALAADPEQADFYAERIAPLVEGEPRWIDGSWVGTYTP